ncbi:aminotransferase class I/II-fold pyridoxal phosphate-dependent enzyme [Romboutsia weinsteinii]|uniref:cysteine-S-conjugate beta-lyase n=1 Tax=Romboutsia weinsteinii TaxID=2020949 RepID=A0A371IYQ3_9FIRM|nr:aminotransferase class I/II-fold pyridoxal phosphate-dependent enzyme [Romboutsia weinsteinii]RDY25612.1 aminotransferase class I/II-fold pyridoxal phosphate-dependent enzyme [Romboutsia weinsteinii]
MYNFEEILSREGNGSKKWNTEYINRRFPNHKTPYYPLFIADMDYKLPREINIKSMEFIQKGDFGYFDVLNKFSESIFNWYKNFNGIYINKNWIMPGIGTLASMNLVVKTMLNQNDNVLIFTPVYGPFKDIVINNEVNLITQALNLVNNRYYIDFDELERNILKNNIKSILMCNPHNPSGRVWSYDELSELVILCKKHNILLISDEVHSDLILNNNKFTSIIEFNKTYENIVVCSSPNKTFNLAGLNSSFLLMPNMEIYEKISNSFLNNKLGINRVGYEFLGICYDNGETWVRELVKNIESNINLVKGILDVEGIIIMNPESGYLLWIKLDKVDDDLNFVEKLARETGVLVETGTRFVASESGYIRINIATSKQILEEAMNKLVKFYLEFIKE